MKYRAYLKPHEVELIEAVTHNLECAKETAAYTMHLIRKRCEQRALAERKRAA